MQRNQEAGGVAQLQQFKPRSQVRVQMVVLP